MPCNGLQPQGGRQAPRASGRPLPYGCHAPWARGVPPGGTSPTVWSCPGPPCRARWRALAGTKRMRRRWATSSSPAAWQRARYGAATPRVTRSMQETRQAGAREGSAMTVTSRIVVRPLGVRSGIASPAGWQLRCSSMAASVCASRPGEQGVFSSPAGFPGRGHGPGHIAGAAEARISMPGAGRPRAAPAGGRRRAPPPPG